jgi:hypothetical protein
MRVVLQGSLQHFAAKELLLFLGSAHSGTFDAEAGGERLRLAIRDGHVVFAEGNGDAVGVMAKLLGWSDGTFTFLDEVMLPEGATPQSHELAAIIAEGEGRNSVASLYPNDGIRFRVVNKPPGEISMTPEEFQILFQIGSGKSLAQLRDEGRHTAADLYPIIKRLQTTGLIESFADRGGPTERGTTAQPPQSPLVTSQPAPPPPAAPEVHEPELVAAMTTDDGNMFPLLEETATIGRTPANTIPLGDGSVSARHARVVRSAEGFVIEDVGSRNGTYINNEKITEKRLLADGDLVRLGKIILTFNLATDLRKKQSTEREMLK